MKQRVIYVMTHDSIGLGEDGPTHQPVEHLPSLRLIPNMTCGARAIRRDRRWRGPTRSSAATARRAWCSRARALPRAAANGRADRGHRGAAVTCCKDCEGTPEAILIATGSEVALAVEAAQAAATERSPRARRVDAVAPACSTRRTQRYREAVLPRAVDVRVAVEAGATETWWRYVGLARRRGRHRPHSATPAPPRICSSISASPRRTSCAAVRSCCSDPYEVTSNAHQSRHQRLRPHRPQHPARAVRERTGSKEIQIVALNDLGDAQTNAHLTRYDTVHGKFPGEVQVEGDSMVVNGDRIKVLAERDPAKLPWGQLGVDVVLECTGLFTSKEKAGAHLNGGAKKVMISAPGGKDVDATDRLRRQPQHAEGEPHGDLQRVVHDQLPGAAGQGAARQDRHRARPHDDDPLVHQRPGADRRVPQGPAPRALGDAVA